MFCNYCGAQVPDDSIFCNKCGKRLVLESHIKSKTNMHTVKITRESQAFLVNPSVNISINGKEYLSIEDGKTIDLQLEEGKYEFIFYQSIKKKDKVISISLDEDIHIYVRWNRLWERIEAFLIK